MNLAAEIAAWQKESGSFAAGVDLYRRSGQQQLLPELEQALRRDYVAPQTYDRLLVSLGAILADLGGEPREIRVSGRQDEDPPEVKALRQQGRLLKKRESDLHGRMKALAQQTDPGLYQEQLYALAVEMMEEVQPALDDVYGQLRAWEQEGKLPVAGREEIVRETVAKMRQVETLRVRCSKLRNWLEGKRELTDEERGRYTAELQEKEHEMEQLRQELQL